MCLQKDYSWNPSTYVSENSKYLKSIADTSVITCDENLSVMDVVSTKMTYTIATNVYILHRVLWEVILLLVTTIICYHYA